MKISLRSSFSLSLVGFLLFPVLVFAGPQLDSQREADIFERAIDARTENDWYHRTSVNHWIVIPIREGALDTSEMETSTIELVERRKNTTKKEDLVSVRNSLIQTISSGVETSTEKEQVAFAGVYYEKTRGTENGAPIMDREEWLSVPVFEPIEELLSEDTMLEILEESYILREVSVVETARQDVDLYEISFDESVVVGPQAQGGGTMWFDKDSGAFLGREVVSYSFDGQRLFIESTVESIQEIEPFSPRVPQGAVSVFDFDFEF